MKKTFAFAALGLSTALGVLTIAKPAAALAPFELVNLKSQQANPSAPLCMGVSGGPHSGHITGGTHMIVWGCTQVTDQVFTLQNTPGLSTFMFQDQVSGPQGQAMCVTDTAGTSDRGSQVVIEPCTGGWGQQFWLNADPNGSGCWYLQNALSGRVIGVANASANPVSNGMSVVMWDTDGSNDQLWCMSDVPTITIP